MAVNVYRFPPVKVLASAWWQDAPTSRSQSLISGKRFVTSWAPPRRMVRLRLSSLAGGRSGAGYLEVLRRYLEGGQSLVRLYSNPINRYIDAQAENPARQSEHVVLNIGGVDVDYQEDSTDVDIYTGRFLSGTVETDGGFPAVEVSGLVPLKLAARPGEFLTVFEDADDLTGETVMVTTEATAGAAGNAMVRVMTAPTHGGRVCIGVSDTAVFEVTDMPPTPQGITGDWVHNWQFREVFSAEVGGFTEVNPWT